jgi:hypothetical protein
MPFSAIIDARGSSTESQFLSFVLWEWECSSGQVTTILASYSS